MRDLIYLLPVIACPIAMGVMMLVMMRGTHGQHDSNPGDEVARLRAEVEQLRAQNPSSQVPLGETPTVHQPSDRPPVP